MIVSRRTAVALTACMAATLATAVAAPPAVAGATTGAAQDTTAGRYVRLTPARLLDTRTGHGGTTPTAHGIVALKVAGAGGVPATGVSAVALTVTVVSAPAGGYVTAYPAGITRPTASNVSFAKGRTVAGLTTARVGTGGVVDLYNGSAGRTPLVADVSGYWTAGTPSAAGSFVAVNPARILDTRLKLGGSEPAGHGQVLLQVGGKGGVPAGAGAVTLTVTATGGTASGSVSVYPDDGTYHAAVSNLNFTAGGTVADQVVVSVPAGGKVVLVNGSTKPVHLVADVAGYYLPGQARTPGTLTATTPSRFLDTRQGADFGYTEPAPRGVVGLKVAGLDSLPPSNISAVVLTLTVTAPQAPGYITTYAGGTARPAASNLNFAKGQTVADLVIAPVGADGVVNFYNGSTGRTQVIVDVTGYYSSVSNPWAATALTLPRGQDSQGVTGVSCPTSSSCVAVGIRSTQTPFLAAPFIETLADGVWTEQEQDAPAKDVERKLSDVSCVSTTSCVAVGFDSEDSPQPNHLSGLVVDVLSDGAWTASELPDPPVATGDEPGNGSLSSVSCTSSTSCVAVGSYSSADADSMLAETYDGTTWTPTRIAAPVGQSGDLAAVSCTSATSCTAVGTLLSNSGQFSAVIETLVNGGWVRDTSLPVAAAQRASGWNDVSCPAAGSCVAVSDESTSATLKNGTWTASAMPYGMNSVSCASAFVCTAAGGYDSDRAGDHQPGVAELHGGAWTLVGLPLARGYGQLYSVSCPTAGSCVAGGNAVVSYSHTLTTPPLLESELAG